MIMTLYEELVYKYTGRDINLTNEEYNNIPIDCEEEFLTSLAVQLRAENIKIKHEYTLVSMVVYYDLDKVPPLGTQLEVPTWGHLLDGQRYYEPLPGKMKVVFQGICDYDEYLYPEQGLILAYPRDEFRMTGVHE